MQDNNKRLDLSITQIAGGALAAASAAFASSYLGVAGTLIGAAAASVIATVASAVYTHSLRRTNERLRTVVLPLSPVRGHAPAASAREVIGSGDATGSSTRIVTEETAVTVTPPGARHAPLRWRPLAAAAALVFVLAMVTVSLVELGVGRSLPALVGGEERSGPPTIARVFGGTSSGEQPSPSSEQQETRERPTSEASSTTAPSQSPSPSPSAEPTPAATPTPTGTPSGEPTTSSPAPTSSGPPTGRGPGR